MVEEDVKGEEDRHGVGGCVVGWYADGDEEEKVDTDVDVLEDYVCPVQGVVQGV